MEVSNKVNKVHEFCTGAGGSHDADVNIAEKEFEDRASVRLEQGPFDVTNKKAEIVGAHDYTWRK